MSTQPSFPCHDVNRSSDWLRLDWLSRLSAHARMLAQQTVRWIMPFAPGGTSASWDARSGTELTRQMGVPFVIDNKGGGGGVRPCRSCARACRGYTIIMSHIGLMAVIR